MTVSKPALRAVEDGEKAPSRKSVTAAADAGTQRELLVAMRARVAAAVEDKNTPARDLAALTKRLLEIVRDIEALDARAAEEGMDSDVIPDAKWGAV